MAPTTEAVSEAAATEKEIEAAIAEFAKADAMTAAADDGGNKKKKGWRKYWLFGPRVGGD